jgi:hypothetical protein
VTNDPSSWQKYERLVASLLVDELSTHLCVTPNARVAGKISKRRRQIDVLIDERHETDNSRRIIVDAKNRKRKIDVTHVESFRGLMEDVGATHGYLVCPAGHTEAALRRAQGCVSICLLSLDHFPSTWPRCQGRRCKLGRVFWDGYPAITASGTFVSSSKLIYPKEVIYNHHVGKCDQCGRFHVLCLTCQELFSFDDEGDHQCRCRMPWFWLTSVEHDTHGQPSAELHAVLGAGKVITADRRPM